MRIKIVKQMSIGQCSEEVYNVNAAEIRQIICLARQQAVVARLKRLTV